MNDLIKHTGSKIASNYVQGCTYYDKIDPIKTNE